MTAALEGGEWSAARPDGFTPAKDPGPILQEAGWAPGPVWTGGKSRPHWDSIPNHPARSQSLYRLSYPAHVHGFILGRNLELLLLSFPGRELSVTAGEVSNTYQFIILYYTLHCDDCALVSGSYPKTYDSSPVVTMFRNSGSLFAWSSMHRQYM